MCVSQFSFSFYVTFLFEQIIMVYLSSTASLRFVYLDSAMLMIYIWQNLLFCKEDQ